MSNLVSVIMPCYNAEKTISDSIKGVLSQTYSNFELLIINDCSTDNSLDIIYHCTLIDNRIKLFSTQFDAKPFSHETIMGKWLELIKDLQK
jgi:glycosyltransferase involved in cell wall biosynthesis